MQKLRLFAIKAPGTVNSFSNFLNELTSIELIDYEMFVGSRSVIEFPERDPFSLNFQNVGIESTLVLVNGESCLTNIMVQVSMISLLPIVFTLERICFPKLKTKR